MQNNKNKKNGLGKKLQKSSPARVKAWGTTSVKKRNNNNKRNKSHENKERTTPDSDLIFI